MPTAFRAPMPLLPLLLATLLLQAGERPAGAVDPADVQRRFDAGYVLVNGVWVQPEAKIAWSDLFAVHVVGGALQLRYDPEPEILNRTRGGRVALVEIDGDLWLLQRERDEWNTSRTGPIRWLDARRASEDVDGEVGEVAARLERIAVRPGETTIHGIVADAAVTLMLSDDPRGPVAFDLYENVHTRTQEQQRDLTALRVANQPAFDRGVLPLVQRLAGRGVMNPGAADRPAAGPVSADMLAAVEACVAESLDPDPAVRKAAAERLGSLGAPAVPAARRLLDRSLPPAAASMLRNFLGRHTLYADDLPPVELSKRLPRLVAGAF